MRGTDDLGGGHPETGVGCRQTEKRGSGVTVPLPFVFSPNAP